MMHERLFKLIARKHLQESSKTYIKRQKKKVGLVLDSGHAILLVVFVAIKIV